MLDKKATSATWRPWPFCPPPLNPLMARLCVNFTSAAQFKKRIELGSDLWPAMSQVQLILNLNRVGATRLTSEIIIFLSSKVRQFWSSTTSPSPFCSLIGYSSLLAYSPTVHSSGRKPYLRFIPNCNLNHITINFGYSGNFAFCQLQTKLETLPFNSRV